jgi:hypothetical protein
VLRWLCLGEGGTDRPILRFARAEESDAVEGRCALSGAGAYAAYTGQSVTCTPERGANGQLSEGYCAVRAARGRASGIFQQ